MDRTSLPRMGMKQARRWVKHQPRMPVFEVRSHPPLPLSEGGDSLPRRYCRSTARLPPSWALRPRLTAGLPFSCNARMRVQAGISTNTR